MRTFTIIWFGQLVSTIGSYMTRKMGKYEGGRRKPLDSSMEQFLNILKWVCWKRDVYFALVDPKGTSQTCPSCQTVTGKKGLDERVHECKTCGYQTDRDVAAAQVVMQRGCVAVGQTVVKLSEGKNSSFPMKKESPGFNKTSVARLV